MPHVEAGAGGLSRAVLAGVEGEAHVYLQGAHVTHWQPRGRPPVLFLSARSRFAADTAIRGGVPVIFPWFGPRAGADAAPVHGFARRRAWTVERHESAEIVLTLDADDATRAVWPHDFRLRLRVALDTHLTIALEVTNPSPVPWTYEEALHTYLAVGDVTAAAVRGLENSTYLDKTDALARKRSPAGPVRIAGEVDRIFVGTTAACVVDDPVFKRRIRLDKRGSLTTVLWNPGVERARALPDLGDDEWATMLCVETANAADDAVTLAPGGRHEMSVTLTCEDA